MKPLESSFSKEAILLLIFYVTFQLALCETDHNLQFHLPRCVLDVSRKHFSPGGTLVISVPNSCTHVRRRFPGIGYTQENCESHDQVAKLLHFQTQWPIITSTSGLTRNITSLYKDQSYVIITSRQVTFVHIIQKLELKGRTGSLHLGPCIRALCVPHIVIVPSVISRGTPHQPAWETSISEGRKLKRI
jgi:hypothetical protein